MDEHTSMTIGAAGRRSGVPDKTIRYYEDIGLIAPARRAANGYRVYEAADVETLRFIRRARSLGFSIGDFTDLLDLWRDRRRTSAEVKRLALVHLAEIDHKLCEFERPKHTLRDLTQRCQGDDRPDCPIIAELTGKFQAGSCRRPSRGDGRG